MIHKRCDSYQMLNKFLEENPSHSINHIIRYDLKHYPIPNFHSFMVRSSSPTLKIQEEESDEININNLILMLY